MKTSISVFGSYAPGRSDADKNVKYPLDGSFAEFSEACRELGKRLALARVELSTCSNTADTADRYVAQGFLDAAQALQDPSLVHVYRPTGRADFDDMLVKYPTLIRLADTSCDSWGVAHLRALRASQAVITIGGLSDTYAAGNAAMLARLRLVPITCFGGASARLFYEFRRELELLHQCDIATLNARCTKENYSALDNAVKLAVPREMPAS